MSWRYSTSYGSRDDSSTRDASQIRCGVPRAAPSEPPGRWLEGSRFSRSSGEPVEHSPVWAKTNVGDNSAAVQRLKERYNISEAPRRETKAYKRAETKDLSAPSSARAYGRSLTSLSLGDGAEGNLTDSKFRRKSEKKPEYQRTGYDPKPSLNLRGLEGRQVLYMPTATAKLLSRKYSNDLSPTTANPVPKSPLRMEKTGGDEDDDDVITVVTRGTSPTPTAPSIYLRSKRADFGLEKRVSKLRKKPNTANKEVQTDREEVSLKYGGYPEAGTKKPWSSYSDKYSSAISYGSRLPTRCNYAGETRRDHWSSHLGLGLADPRRSTSREESDEVATPESPQKTLTWRPPTSAKTPPASPVKNSEKKSFGGKSPPSSARSSLKLDCPKLEPATNPTSPHLSPLQCKMIKVESLQSPVKNLQGQSPKVTVDRCPDIHQTIDDVSSASESSEEETTSEEEAEPADAAMTVKKSVTNFLQNIPNTLPQNQSKTNVFLKLNSLSPQKINFKRIESGEKAWWMESSEKVPEDLARANSPRSPRDDQEAKAPNLNNFLSPPLLINRQFTRDMDWLKASSENVAETLRNNSAVESPTPSPSEAHGCWGAKPLANGDSRETNLDVSPALRRREFSKSPDNFLSEESNHQMKFNQRPGDPLKGERNFLADLSREFAVKDATQKLHNGLGSPLDEKNFLEPGDMSGLISKAKAGLAKSKTKPDIKKSSSREMSPKLTDNKSEIDLYWRELADSLNRPLHLCDLDFTDLNTDDETDVLGNSKACGEVPPPPPMLVLPAPAKLPGAPAPAPPCNAGQQPRGSRTPAAPPAPQIVKNKKTVKLFWKEVKDEPAIVQKTPDGAALIWDELTKVKVDTQKLEYLFESRAKDLVSKKQQDQNKNKEIIVLDPKRSNAINIGMTKLPPPRAIKTAILKMDSTVVNKEGIEKILTMLPTEEEKLRIQEAQNLNPDVPLGSAEQFLLTLTSINELEARLKLWAFKLDFENSEKEICEPLMDLKQGMEILKANKTFRGILSTLLSVGNFLNGYDVKGFQIEYLSKVPEVKDTVHKHSLLHHLCIIVMDKFPDSTDLYSEIGAVTRASKVDFDELAANIKKVEEECKLSWNYLKMIAKHEGHTAMKVKMSDFLADCAERIIVLGTIHKRIINRFRKFAFWLGVPTNRISTTRPNEVFKIISEFALEYRTTRDRVLVQIKKMNREKSRTRGYYSSSDTGRKMNSKEAKDDARLKELLGGDLTSSEISGTGSTWRRQRRDTKNLVLETNNDDDEILETLIKTANQVPSSRAALKERRRSRVYGKYCK